MSTDSTGEPDIREVETSLQRLWDRARRVSELVVSLRKENEELRSSLSEERQAHENLSENLRLKEQELGAIQTELRKLQQNGSSFLNREEKETLAAKIKDLISKIESRL